MTARESGILKAAYFALLAIGQTPSVRKLADMYRQISGEGLRTDKAREWLSSPEASGIRLGYATGYDSDTDFVLKSSDSGYTTGNDRARDIRNCLKENYSTTPSGVVPTTLFPVPDPPPKKTGERKNRPLGLDGAEKSAAGAALAQIKPTFDTLNNRGGTWTAWRTRNWAPTFDMVKAGRSADEIATAWIELAERRGYPVPMKWVQENFLRSGATPRSLEDEVPEIEGNLSDPPTATALRRARAEAATT